MGVDFCALCHDSFQFQDFLLESRNGRPLFLEEGCLSDVVGLLFRRFGVGFGEGFCGCLERFSVADQVFINSRVEVLSLSIRQDHGIVGVAVVA